MTLRNYMKENLLVLDGGMGTLLQEKGLRPGEKPEEWNLSHPDAVRSIHQAYFEAGSNVVSANTFGANSLRFSSEHLEEIVSSALDLAREAQKASKTQKETFVALDIGPLGRLLEPLGDLPFERAVEVFAQTVRLGVKYGADLIFIETMTDTLETKAAVLAAKENSDLPVFVSNAYDEKGELLTGASPGAVVAMLEGLGVDAMGMNCSLGPRELLSVAREYLRFSSLPILFKPNAGIPRSEKGKTVFDVGVEEFALECEKAVIEGVGIVGGCCGTTPDYIRALTQKIKERKPNPITKKQFRVISSYTQAVYFGDHPILIGERINPTGKKRLKEALRSGDMDYVLSQAIQQEEAGAHVLDVNVGLPEICEEAVLAQAVRAIQGVTSLPLQIDTVSPQAMEQALRHYNGKAMVNSVSGKEESMASIFPLVQKYGGFVVALTLDDTGIPETAEGRVAIAKKILDRAKEYGLSEKDLIFDPLTMPVSASPEAALVTLEALYRIRTELGCLTSLGVSNVSFGLPERNAVNAAFFIMALQKGLDAAIMNPTSFDMMRSYRSYLALVGKDENFKDYITFSQSFQVSSPIRTSLGVTSEKEEERLMYAIEKGRSSLARRLTEDMIGTRAGLDIVREEIIPALDAVGKGYEEKTVYLPQLLMSAEAAQSAFEVIREHMRENDQPSTGISIVLATVQGDVHDIGKNIVRLLLENYGFAVTDLGKDVAPEQVLQAVLEIGAPLVGLSALMTTTVPAMETTVRLIKEKAPHCKVMVGGAVLTSAYAETIGADFYGADAMEAVRIAEQVQNNA